MEDERKTKKQLIEELNQLRQSVAELKGFEKAIEQTRVNQEKFTKAFRQSSIPVGITTLKEGRFVDVSDVSLRFMGRKRDDVIGHTTTEIGFITEEQRTSFFEKLNKSGSIENHEMKVKTKDGVLRYGLFNAVLLNLNNEKCLLSVMTDITGRKQTEEALLKSEENFHRFMDESILGVRIVTIGGETLYANQAFLDIHGYVSIEELKTTPTEKRYTPESYAEFQIRREKRKRSADVPSGYTIDIIRKTGEIRHLQVYRKEILWNGERQYQVIYQDITERKLAEKKLMNSEEKFRKLAESSPVAIMMHQGDRWIYANSAAEEISGYSKKDLYHMHFWDIVHPDHRDMVRQSGLDRQQEKVLPHAYEFKIIAKNDNVKWVSLTGNPIQYDDKPSVLITVMDITERKMTEAALKESESKYRLVFESLEDLYFQTDENGVIRVLSPSVYKLTGWSLDELIGKPTMDIYANPRERGNFLTAISRSGFVKDYETILKKKDGTQAWVSFTAKILTDPDGRPCGMAGTLRDITDRKRAADALRQSEEKYRTILESIQDGYFELDLAGNYTFANEANCRFLGYTKEELVGMNYRQHTDEKNANKLYQPYHELYRTGKPIESLEVESIGKDGNKMTCDTSVSLIRDSEGKPTGFRAISRNITYRKHAEDEKRSLEERLQRAEKMEALGTLAGGVAHDLNNVLGVIVGYSELVLSEVDKSSPIRPRLMNIMNGSEKAAAIVQDLLTLARRGVSGRKVLNLNKIIVDYQNSPELEKLYSYHLAVRIKVDLEQDLLNISGSPVHLGKALFNLVSNAVEAMPKGGDLTVKTANQYLDKPIHGYDNIREGDYVVLSITDTGEGIPSADLQRIFEPFYTKKVMGRSGTGLGLAVVWGTVKDHQGYINVQSEEGKGSTFTLYFPITRGDITAEYASVSISEYMGKGETILVVDDVREQRDLAVEILKKINYKVSSVSSGEEAITYIKEHKIDLLVLDMIMEPGIDGLDTYMGIVDIRPKQKAIIVSGFSETERVNAAHKLGAGAYVKKPYVMEKLGMAVRKELDRFA